MDTGPVALVLLVSLLGLAMVVHLIEWRLYTAARDERDEARADLAAMTADRDGWRSVGERALLVAHLGQRVGARALGINPPRPTLVGTREQPK